MNGWHDRERLALERLIRVALQDTGQSRRCADFLLAWWNAHECGGFDLTDLWSVDRAIAADMCTVFAALVGYAEYPDSLGYRRDFERLIALWGPSLGQGSERVSGWEGEHRWDRTNRGAGR